MEFDDSKFCRIVEDLLLYQQGNKQLLYKCNRNFTISQVCLDLQYYKPICLFVFFFVFFFPELLLDYGLAYQLICSDPNQMTNFGRKLAFKLVQGFKLSKNFADVIIINKAPVWISDGCLLPAQHNISLHYYNRRPTLLSWLLDHIDFCVEPIKNQIMYWKARIISYDFEAYPKNMGYLIATDSFHQIFYNKKIDPVLTKSITEDIKLLDEYRRDILGFNDLFNPVELITQSLKKHVSVVALFHDFSNIYNTINFFILWLSLKR